MTWELWIAQKSLYLILSILLSHILFHFKERNNYFSYKHFDIAER